MSFNFQSFMTALTGMLPTIGAIVEQLHPGDQQEAAKINVGTQLITSLVTALNVPAAAPATPAVVPAPAPAPAAPASTTTAA